jgi:hypothetical protein
MVYVDEYPIGVSPVSTSFTFYGTRRIRLLKDGYEPLTIMEPMWPPWYDIPPLDFFSENLVPGELRDQRDFCYQLKPQVIVPPEQLLARGEQLRRNQPVSPLTASPATHQVVVPPPAQPAAGTQLIPVQPAPETISAPPPQVSPQGVGPAQPGAAPNGPPIGGQLPYPLPPP